MNRKTNLVIIMADQLRYDAIGPNTPHINKLQQESVVFERAYCASPLCVPARGAFFTGNYPNETGSLINPWTKQEEEHGTVRPEHTNMYRWMERQWDSWHTGKQHLYAVPKPENDPDSETSWRQLEGRYEAFMKANGKRKPGGPGFKGMVPEMADGAITRTKSYSIPTTGCFEEGFDFFYDGFIANDSLESIRNRDKSKPFMLNAMFVAPHPPLEVPEPWYSRVKDAQLPDNVGRWSPNESPLQLYNLTGALGTRYTRDDWQRIWPVYLGLVSLLDDCVGMIVEELKAQGMYDETLIVFTSDHGEMLGSHCLWQKMCMYEESVKTPLMMKFPANYEPAVKRIEAPVSSIDVFPTICEAMGIEPPAGISGVSLMPLVEGRSSSARETVFIQYDGNGARGNFQRCVVRGRHKLIVDMFKDETFLELYDLERDPQEHVNLAFEHNDETITAIMGELLSGLRTHMESTGDLLTIPANAYDTFITNYLPFQR